MKIQFRKDRLLNSCRIYKSDISRIDADSSDLFLNQSHFRVSWDAINSQAEKYFRTLPALSKRLSCQSYQSPRESFYVVCIVPYYNNHNYLWDAIISIMKQTRKPDRIVIGIDNSCPSETSQDLHLASLTLESAGIDVSVEHFTGLNGPYYILNSIINKLDDSVILWLHDSDDISHPTRLEKQIAYMEYHHLDICGSFELRFTQSGYELFQYPINVKRALLIEPGHCMLWPSSLIKASLWRRLDGCSDTFRFGADTEFFLRACFIARLGNIPTFLYARRRRSNSLTASRNTGLRSWTRGYINSIYKAEYYLRQIIRSEGNTPLVTPRFTLANKRSTGERSIEELTEVHI